MRKRIKGKIEGRGLHLAVGLIGIVSFAHFVLDGSVTNVMVHDAHLKGLESIETKLDTFIEEAQECLKLKHEVISNG